MSKKTMSVSYSYVPKHAFYQDKETQAYTKNQDLSPVSTTRVHGPSSRVSKNAPEFTVNSARELG